MSERPVLWQNLRIGASRSEAVEAFPELVAYGGKLRTEFSSDDCDFDVELSFDSYGLAEVVVSLIRNRSNLSMMLLCQTVTSRLMDQHGKGLARSVTGKLFRKRWDKGWIQIELVALDDDLFPVLTVSYRKIAIFDAAARYL